MIISCAGLGPVDPPIAAGAAAPSSPLSQTVNTVTVTIGGQPATVVSAALAPDMAGIYQVTATVPAGITPAPAIDVAKLAMGARRLGAMKSPPGWSNRSVPAKLNRLWNPASAPKNSSRIVDGSRTLNRICVPKYPPIAGPGNSAGMKLLTAPGWGSRPPCPRSG